MYPIKPPALACGDAASKLFRLTGFRQQIARVREEDLAGRRKRDALVVALEQAHPELLLEVPDGHAQRRLRYRKPTRRATEVQLFGCSDEVTQLTQLHSRQPTILFGYRST